MAYSISKAGVRGRPPLQLAKVSPSPVTVALTAISTGWLQSRLLEMLDRGDFDLVAVGRALIANPDWPKLVRSGDTLALKPYSKDLLADLA